MTEGLENCGRKTNQKGPVSSLFWFGMCNTKFAQIKNDQHVVRSLTFSRKFDRPLSTIWTCFLAPHGILYSCIPLQAIETSLALKARRHAVELQRHEERAAKKSALLDPRSCDLMISWILMNSRGFSWILGSLSSVFRCFRITHFSPVHTTVKSDAWVWVALGKQIDICLWNQVRNVYIISAHTHTKKKL